MAVKKQRARGPAETQQSTTNQTERPATGKSKTSKKALIIAKEIKFARLLACNNKKTRDTVLKNLKKWLTIQSRSSFVFTEEKLMRLWRGLFYCMWMSDKPLIQEELAESLSKIVHCFDGKDVIFLYTRCALGTLGTEWFGIDQYRLDKFAMLVRRIIRQTFQVCKERSWDSEYTRDFSGVLEEILLDAKISHGFKMHIIELFWEEMSKISGGDISEDVVTVLIKPFVEYLVRSDDERQAKHVMRHIFRHLIFQSDVGLDYQEKFAAWRQAGFPTGRIDAMEPVALSDNEEETNGEEEEEVSDNEQEGRASVEKPLDPRAGRVNVELPQIPFNARNIAELLTQYKVHQLSTTISRRQILRLITEFNEVSRGVMPLGLKKVKLPNTRKGFTNTKTAALRLLQFEQQLYADKPKGKRKRKRNGQLMNDEVVQNGSGTEDDVVCDSEIGEEEKEEEEEEEEEQDEDEGTPRKKAREEASLNESEATGPVSKRKSKKKRQNGGLVEEEAGSSALKKLKSLLTNTGGKAKKAKAKQNGTARLTVTAKKKKGPRVKVCGSWDISNNPVPSPAASPLAKETKEQAKLEEASVSSVQETANGKLENQTMWLVPALKKIEHEKSKGATGAARQAVKISKDSSSKKRVKIVLQRNTAQHTSEYIKQIRQSPAIPFDANKKPPAGVLKASPIPSPINPFYKKNFK